MKRFNTVRFVKLGSGMSLRSLVAFILLVSACLTANAATEQIILNSSWSEHDPFQLGSGVQTLSGESASGFTSSHSSAVSDLGEQPRVYQEFTGVDTSQVGQKLTATFDVQFHDVLPEGDTKFRFGFGDTTTNQGMVPIMIDMGPAFGSSIRMRYDNSITDTNDGPASTYSPGNYSGFLSASGTFGNGGGTPTGESSGGLGVDVSTIHTFTTTIERVERNVDFSFPPDGVADGVANGWYTTVTWTSDAAPPDAEPLFYDTNNGDFAEFDVDTGLGVYEEDVWNSRGRIENIDTLGFLLFNNEPFTGGSGSYTISNLVVEYDDGVPVDGDYNGDGVVDAADYTVWRDTRTSTTELAADGNENGVIDAPDYDFWVQNYGGPEAAGMAAAVPEPTAGLLAGLACGLIGLGSRRSWC